jgi:hypothetical protein
MRRVLPITRPELRSTVANAHSWPNSIRPQSGIIISSRIILHLAVVFGISTATPHIVKMNVDL